MPRKPKGELSEMTWTLRERQIAVGRHVGRFFGSPKAFLKLYQILGDQPERIGPVILYYITEYDPSKIVRSEDGSVMLNPYSLYNNELRTNRKALFDFSSRCGKGTLIRAGQRNPPVRLPVPLGCEDACEPVLAPLPLLNACRWFIDLGFADHFLALKDELYREHSIWAYDVKRAYSRQHKQRIRIRTEIAEEIVRKGRAAGIPADAPLTEEERAMVENLLGNREVKNAADQRHDHRRQRVVLTRNEKAQMFAPVQVLSAPLFK